MRATLLRGTLLLALVPSLRAQTKDPIAGSRAEYQQALKAYEAKDYAAFLTHARRAQELRPSHGGVTYALASAYALAGDTGAAVQTLRRYAALGYTADLAEDADFSALRGLGTYAGLQRLLARNREPVVRGTVAFELDERDLLAEGIAYDEREGAFFVSAVHARKIVRVGPDGRATDFAKLERDPAGTPLGLRVDQGSRALFAVVAAMPQMRGSAKADSGTSALLRYDLDSGTLAARFPAPADGQAHGFGDLEIGKDGTVYVSDSRAPVIYRLPPGGSALEPFVESPLLLSTQGLALTPDGRALFVADYARGILRVDVRSGAIATVPTSDTVAALGIDGLYYANGSLIGIQNGVAPHRVLRLRLGQRGTRIEAAEVLERAHPRHEEPTLGVVVGRELYYVANSQYERFGTDGTVTAPDGLSRPVVLRLRL